MGQLIYQDIKRELFFFEIEAFSIFFSFLLEN